MYCVWFPVFAKAFEPASGIEDPEKERCCQIPLCSADWPWARTPGKTMLLILFQD